MEEKKKNTAKKSKSDKTPTPKREPQGDVIFALDIGTHSVIGVLAKKTPQGCKVIDVVSEVHEKRSMADGQIEDIASVSADIKRVKSQLEKRQNIMLHGACIAAAGRALKTLRASWEYKLANNRVITREDMFSAELEAVRKTSESFTKENDGAAFYCVGHSVVSRSLDGFKSAHPEGHRGEILTTDIIAAFLPSYVVESLCTAVDNAGLEVSRLTLEPIAAMSVIVPPELRLINIALCDIGAGTSDIAISRDGSIVAYGMATTAGDEISEMIMKELLVDFETAERLKTSSDTEISYKNILLADCKISNEELIKLISPAARELAKVIAEEIISANVKPPQAVFLVGGGSKLQGLGELVAEELNIDPSKVISGRKELLRGVTAPDDIALNTEHTTPLGIVLSSDEGVSYDFTTITVNGKKMRTLDTNRLTVFELMPFAKISPEDMISAPGKTVNFTVSGEKITLRGKPPKPSEITVNGKAASLNTVVNKGDIVSIVPAVKGEDGTAHLSDYFDLSTVRSCTVTLFGEKRRAGRYILINGRETVAERRIWDGDSVEFVDTDTLGRFLEVCGINEPVLLNGMKVSLDAQLKSADVITRANETSQNEETASLQQATDSSEKAGLKITVNGIETEFPLREDGNAPIFLDVAAAFSDNPTELLAVSQTITVNGKIARLDEEIHSGDIIVIE